MIKALMKSQLFQKALRSARSDESLTEQLERHGLVPQVVARFMDDRRSPATEFPADFVSTVEEASRKRRLCR